MDGLDLVSMVGDIMYHLKRIKMKKVGMRGLQYLETVLKSCVDTF